MLKCMRCLAAYAAVIISGACLAYAGSLYGEPEMLRHDRMVDGLSGFTHDVISLIGYAVVHTFFMSHWVFVAMWWVGVLAILAGTFGLIMYMSRRDPQPVVEPRH